MFSKLYFATITARNVHSKFRILKRLLNSRLEINYYLLYNIAVEDSFDEISGQFFQERS